MSWTIVLYLALVGVGIIIGTRKSSSDKDYSFLGKVQGILLIVLVVVLGIKIGADERVVTSLGSIGAMSFVLTVFMMGGSVLCMYLIRRFILKTDKRGGQKDD